MHSITLSNANCKLSHANTILRKYALNWEDRFRIQLHWTTELRNYLFDKISLSTRHGVLLEIGCGSGELIKEIGLNYNVKLHGIDIDEERVELTKNNLNAHGVVADIKQMDILNNNFLDEQFEIIITNYLFLWIKDLNTCFTEIHRILKKGGILLILGEPDYGGLIENPNTGLRENIILNLESLGADGKIARKLNQFFNNRFKVIESFCTSIPWTSDLNKKGLLKEVNFFREVLSEQEHDWRKMKKNIEMESYFLFIPIFSFYLEKI